MCGVRATLSGNSFSYGADSTLIYSGNRTTSDTEFSGVANLKIEAGTITLNDDGAISKNLTIQGGILDVGGNNFTVSETATGAGTLQINAGNVTINGNSDIGVVQFDGNGILDLKGSTNSIGTLTDNVGEVRYLGGAQTIANVTYYNLTLGAGTKIAEDLTVKGLLTVDGTLSATNLTLEGTIDNNGGTIQASGLVAISSANEISGTFVYDGTAQTIDDDNIYKNLTLSGGTKTALDLKVRDLIVSSDTILNVGDIDIFSSIDNQGTIQATGSNLVLRDMNTGIFIYNGAGQTFQNVGYYDLVLLADITGVDMISNVSNKLTVESALTINKIEGVVHFENKGITTVETDLTLTGNLLNNNGSLFIGGNADFGTTETVGGTITYNGSSDQNIAGVTYKDLTFAGASTKKTRTGEALETLGHLILNAGLTLDLQDNLTVGGDFTNAGTTIAHGNFILSGSLISNNSLTLIGAVSSFGATSGTVDGTVTYDMIGDQTIGSGVTYNDLRLNNAGTKTASGALGTVGDLMVASSQQLNVTGNLEVGGNFQNGGVTDVDGAFTLSTGSLTANNDLTIGGDTDFGATTGIVIGKVTYDGSHQTIGSGVTYNDLSLGTLGGTKTASDSIAVLQKLVVEDNQYLDLKESLTVLGTITNSGVIDVAESFILLGFSGDPVLDMKDGSELYLAGNRNRYDASTSSTEIGGTVYYGSDYYLVQEVISASYYNLYISGSGKKSVIGDGNVKVRQDLTLSTSAVTLDAHDLTVSGSIANTGTIQASGTVSLDYDDPEVGGTFVYDGEAQDIAKAEYNILKLSTGNTKTLSGDVTISSELIVDFSVTLDTDGYSINIAGDWTNSGTFTANSGKVTFSGTGAQTITNSGANSDFYDLTLSGTGTKTMSSALVVTNILDVANTGVILDALDLTVSESGSITNTGTIQASGSVSLDYDDPEIGGRFIYDGGAQNIAEAEYEILQLSIGNTKTLTGDVTISNELIVDSNVTLSADSYKLEIEDTWTHSGTFTAGTGTVDYTGAAQDVAEVTYNNLTLSGDGIKALTGNITIEGNLLINADTSINMANNDITANGDWTNSGSNLGTTTASFGLVTFSGGDQTINLNGTDTFGAVTIGGTTGTKTVSGSNLLGKGIFTVNSGATLTLGTANIIVDDYITVNSGATVNVGAGRYFKADKSSSGTFTMAGTLNNTGHVVSDGTFDASGGTIDNTGNLYLGGSVTDLGTLSETKGSVIYYNSGTGTQTVFGDIYHNLYIGNGWGTPDGVLGGDVTVSGILTVASGASLDTETHDITVSGISTISGGLTVSDSGTFNAIGDFNATAGSVTFATAADGTGGTLELAGTSNNLGTFSAGNGTVEYAGTAAQNILSETYYNLIVSSGTKTLTDGLTVNNDLTINSSATLDTSVTNYSINIGGDWTNSGTFNNHDAGTVEFDGTVEQTIDNSSGTGDFYDLTLSGTGTKTMSSALVVTHDLSVSGGATLAAIDLTVSGTGSVSNSGTIKASGSVDITSTGTIGGTFEYDGTTATQAIDTGNAYSTLKLSSGEKTASSTLTVNDTLELVAADVTLDVENLSVAGTGTITNSGIIKASGTVTIPATVGGTFEYDGTNAQDIIGATYNNLTISGTGTKTIQSLVDVTVNETFNLTSSQLKFIAGTEGDLTSLTLNGTVSGAGSINSQYINYTEVVYGGAGDQDILAGNYYDLILSGGTEENSSEKISKLTVGVSHKLTVEANTTLKLDSGDVWSKGTLNATSGSLKFSNETAANLHVGGSVTSLGTFTAGIGTVEYYGAGGNSVYGETYNNLTIGRNEGWGIVAASLGETVTVGGDLTVKNGSSLTTNIHEITANGTSTISGSLTISDSGTFDANGDFDASAGSVTFATAADGTLELAGSVVSLGTLSTDKGTVIYDGGDQDVYRDTYHNLTIAGTGTKTLAEGITVNSDLTINASATLDTKLDNNHSITLKG